MRWSIALANVKRAFGSNSLTFSENVRLRSSVETSLIVEPREIWPSSEYHRRVPPRVLRGRGQQPPYRGRVGVDVLGERVD